jgi:hypothetical protein
MIDATACRVGPNGTVTLQPHSLWRHHPIDAGADSTRAVPLPAGENPRSNVDR